MSQIELMGQKIHSKDGVVLAFVRDVSYEGSFSALDPVILDEDDLLKLYRKSFYR